jgi:hypothetical protein
MGATPKPREGDQYSEQEAKLRLNKLVRAALNTRPKPLKTMGLKGVPVQSKKFHKRLATKAARAEVEAIRNERPRWNQQHAEVPVKPPVADANAGKELLRRLQAGRRAVGATTDGIRCCWCRWRTV